MKRQWGEKPVLLLDIPIIKYIFIVKTSWNIMIFFCPQYSMLFYYSLSFQINMDFIELTTHVFDIWQKTYTFL